MSRKAKVRCNHRGYEVLYKKVRSKANPSKILRRLWECSYCKKKLKGPLPPTKEQLLVRTFKAGLTIQNVSWVFQVSERLVGEAIRKALT